MTNVKEHGTQIHPTTRSSSSRWHWTWWSLANDQNRSILKLISWWIQGSPLVEVPIERRCPRNQANQRSHFWKSWLYSCCACLFFSWVCSCPGQLKKYELWAMLRNLLWPSPARNSAKPPWWHYDDHDDDHDDHTAAADNDANDFQPEWNVWAGPLQGRVPRGSDSSAKPVGDKVMIISSLMFMRLLVWTMMRIRLTVLTCHLLLLMMIFSKMIFMRLLL